MIGINIQIQQTSPNSWETTVSQPTASRFYLKCPSDDCLLASNSTNCIMINEYLDISWCTIKLSVIVFGFRGLFLHIFFSMMFLFWVFLFCQATRFRLPSRLDGSMGYGLLPSPWSSTTGYGVGAGDGSVLAWWFWAIPEHRTQKWDTSDMIHQEYKSLRTSKLGPVWKDWFPCRPKPMFVGWMGVHTFLNTGWVLLISRASTNKVITPFPASAQNMPEIHRKEIILCSSTPAQCVGMTVLNWPR